MSFYVFLLLLAYSRTRGLVWKHGHLPHCFPPDYSTHEQSYELSWARAKIQLYLVLELKKAHALIEGTLLPRPFGSCDQLPEIL